MAFLKFSRDKRGYEHFYLIQPTDRRGAKIRPRVLYWFRTPPNIKVGRQPFAPDVQRTLEATNPDVQFDWSAIVNTPIPPFDAEHWRERRRVDRETRRAAAEGEGDAGQSAEPQVTAQPDLAPSESPAQVSAASVESVKPADAVGPADRSAGGRRRRRRRRRGRGARPETVGASSQGEPEAIQEVEPGEAAESRGQTEEADDEIDGPTGEV